MIPPKVYLLIPIAAAVFLCSCKDAGNANTAPTPSPTLRTITVAQQEGESQIVPGDWDDSLRDQARQAAIDFVKTEFPKWSVKGVASEPYRANTFWIDVDMDHEGRSIVISLAARRFFPQSGEAYWKAFPLRKSREAQLHALKDADILEQLADAEHQIEELKRSAKE